jgi:hypothetical protein
VSDRAVTTNRMGQYQRLPSLIVWSEHQTCTAPAMPALPCLMPQLPENGNEPSLEDAREYDVTGLKGIEHVRFGVIYDRGPHASERLIRQNEAILETLRCIAIIRTRSPRSRRETRGVNASTQSPGTRAASSAPPTEVPENPAGLRMQRHLACALSLRTLANDRKDSPACRR